MTDIVETLRDMHASAADSCDPDFNRALIEAAAEIERLRRAACETCIDAYVTKLLPEHGTRVNDTRGKMTDFKELRTRSENHDCAWCDIGDDMVAEIERLRAEKADMLAALHTAITKATSLEPDGK